MKRVVVVGGGVVGLSCAYALSKRGFSVTVVDAAAPGAGASEGNAGWITPSLSMPVPAPGVVVPALKQMLRADGPLYIRPTLDPRRIRWLLRLLRNCNRRAYRVGFDATARLNALTFDSFDQLAREGIEMEMHRAGLLLCFIDPGHTSHVLEDLQHVSFLGYDPRVLSGSEVRDLEPGIARDVRAGIYLEQERQVRPESLVTGYHKRLVDEGIEVRVAWPVQGFLRRGPGVVAVQNGDEVIEADEFVIAAGAHSGRVAALLGRRVPIDAGKGYSLHYEPPPAELSHALYLYESKVGVTPFDGALRLAGTMEFSGLNTKLRPKRVSAIADAATRYIAGWSPQRPGRAWAGMRPMAPDGLPVIGRIARNVTIASGHAMLGVTLAPVTGELVAQVIATQETPPVLQPFDPGRFAA